MDGYRKQTLTLYQISQMLGLFRMELEDFLGHNQEPLAERAPADLDREAAIMQAAFRKQPPSKTHLFHRFGQS